MPNNEDTRTTVANAEKLAVMANDITYIKAAMDDLKKLINDVRDGYVTKEAFKALERRVDAIESNQTWAGRTLIGGIITLILTASVSVIALIKALHL